MMTELSGERVPRRISLLYIQCARVGCATDDDFVPFACLDFAVKTLEELPHWMDLMNKDLLLWTKDVVSSVSSFKQDPKLAAAIDKLVCNNQLIRNSETGVTLPERKLDFSEVQRLVKESTGTNNIADKTPDTILKEALDTRKALIKKVEDILDNINKSAEDGDTPKLTIRNQRLWSNCIYDLDRVTLKCINDAKKTTITYNSNDDKTRFNTIVFVLTKVHELLSKNLTVTRRELFYQNVTRLRNQANLDVAVRDVCCLLETPPWNLGIVATAKGLIAGPLTMHTRDGNVVDCMASGDNLDVAVRNVCCLMETPPWNLGIVATAKGLIAGPLTMHTRDGNVVDCMASGGTIIPQDINGIKEFRSTAKYILVVEKDAIFQKLLDEGALIRLGPVIILTGKGYPDVCTRQLLCRLCAELRLRALALVDADPHGFEIFLTYKYGSLAQSHLSSSLACSSLSLLGARHHDVMTLAPSEARLRLTDLDKRKLNSLLRRPYLDTPTGSKIKEELSAMLASAVKAEIEAVAPTAAALCDAYLPAKLIQADYLG
ncbi:type IIB DNA topoisomerase domain-containing protein [Phthorimaea operculella]|nr:type IIB DNA topoisomerase domain-containing protein [Phthorimaea operculella]